MRKALKSVIPHDGVTKEAGRYFFVWFIDNGIDEQNICITSNQKWCDMPCALKLDVEVVVLNYTAIEAFTSSINLSRQTFLHFYNGEFDPGSGRTLAAWIRHASRAGSAFFNSSEENIVVRAANG